MKRIKAEYPYKPEVTIEQILAYEKNKPETHTCSGLVNRVCEALADKKVLTGGQVAEHLGLESKHLAFALEVLTGHNTSDIRAELVADRWRKYKKAHPFCLEDDMARDLGFADGSALIKFMQRNRRRFPELYLQEEERYNQMVPLVERLVPKESATVRRVLIRLPYQGSQEEKEACLRLLCRHGQQVAALARSIAIRFPDLFPFLDLVESCAMLHNVGIVRTDMPQLHCHGKKPYILHGDEGCDILGRLRLRIESLVANCHLGSGIPFEEKYHKNLPVSTLASPKEPIEKLICYASCFYSIFNPEHKKSLEEIRSGLSQYGADAVKRFDELHRMFG